MEKNEKYECKEHDEDCIFICDEYNVPVCSRCVAGKERKHEGHKVFKINETISSWNTIFKDEIETTLQEDIRILNELEKCVDVYDYQVKSVIKVIREDEKQLKQMVDEKVKSMIDDVKMKTSCEKDIMANLVTDTKSRIETKTALEDRRKHLEKERPNLAVIYDMKTLHDKFSKIEIGVSPSSPSIDYKPKEASGFNLHSVFGTYIFRPLKYNLPKGIEMRRDTNGKLYFADHNTETTTRDFSLPYGWEKRYTLAGHSYYVDHSTKRNTWTDPRQKK
ncbi:WWP2 [Mytilus coruscus]|uniref:WWP2 n=1 Tax=Mytilus coruscus TaxID=42192 RepID=A0A6J7ZY54_MYTCO|nr:WWP2 [Mytilus coruscus]